mmetsp:Transcript_13169/g.18230  ORF Transcript_13169/g.18230 Transcript_13169/m.18230 type:complete len:1650 (+) Transcript_13169:155-5104(+)|eukprot:CAMPEP_0184478580 /NCGR_PEP_ID=MMETSP0113_2-20130426/567_1 /TAXON_ID=91329 /ORGANISM="Norrisiella sphaerica, Strain BC52" /LENGTH=1649 /DNA_ID=CAMNT_0026856427 /DNA_START=133 /DNA_END=5082 /DNA_ORIENTATION=+
MDNFIFSFCKTADWKRDFSDQFSTEASLDNACFTEVAILFPAHLAAILLFLLRYWFLKDVSFQDQPAIRFTGSSIKLQNAKIAASLFAAIIALLQLFSVVARGTAPEGNGVAALELIIIALISGMYGLGAFVLHMEKECYVKAGGWTLRLGFILAGIIEIFKFQGVIKSVRSQDVNTFFIVYLVYLACVWGISLLEMFVYPTEYEVLRGTDYRALHSNVRKCDIASPEKDADFLSLLTFNWMSSLLRDGYRKPLQSEDIYGLASYDQSKTLSAAWGPVWEDARRTPNPSLRRAISEVWGWRFWGGGFLKLINDGAQFVGPIFLNLLVSFVGDKDQPAWKGYMYAGLLFTCTMIGAVGEAQYFQIVMRVGMQVRSALQNSVFKKSMYISNKGRREGKYGSNLAVNNLISSDCENIEFATRNFHILWSSPLRIFVSMFLLYQQLSWPSLVGAAFLVLMMPLQKQVVTKLTQYARAGFKRADKRVKKEKEAVEAMQIVKCYAWEQSFVTSAGELRQDELAYLKKSAILGAFNMCLIFSVPVLVSSISFAVYILAGNELTAAKAFTSLALYNVLRMPLIFFPQVIAQLTVALASMDRLEDYLSRSEVEEKPIVPIQEGVPAVTIAEGTFSWGSLEKKSSDSKQGPNAPMRVEMDNKASSADCATEDDYLITLKDINLEAENGQLVAVIGSTGSGKSSLLHAILGEIPMKGGVVQTRGTVSYVPQQAWIFNATIRDNILFGEEYDEDKYSRAIMISGLVKDLQNLVAGDMTEIGERGINLSGGQKQRVSIARAVYADCDVYLFDDPFSALDAHVGKDVFEKCVHRGLRMKTRILVTNQIQFIHKADKIIWLNKNPVDGSGMIYCQGTFQELMRNNQEFNKMMSEQGQTEESGQAKTEQQGSATDQKHGNLGPVELKRMVSSATVDSQGLAKKDKKIMEAKAGGGSLIVREGREQGTVQLDVIKAYVTACGGTVVLVILMSLWIGTQALSQATNFWITVWTENMLGDGYSVEFYLAIYVAWTIAQSIGEFLSSYYFALKGIDGAQYLHSRMFESLLMAPMRFYNETPLGRIINRLTKDQSDIDRNLSRMISLAVRGVLNLVGTMVIIGVVQYYILIMFAPVLYLFWYAQRYFQCTAREVKRLDSVTRSPIYAQFNQCLDGTSSIRAYRAQPRLIEDFYGKVDNNVRMYLTIISSNRWLALRLELLGALIAVCAAIVVVVTRNTVKSGAAGLALSQAFAVTGVLNLVVRLTAEAENNLNSVERVNEYGRLESEAAARKEGDPGKAWPAHGHIRFENVQMRYRPGLPLVLRGLSFEVKPGEKVGIVGRTGAGKSSLFVTLYRLVELCGGKIVIDNVDITKIGLWSLREKLSIIPQDPVLFRGTIRFNMDPFNEHEDHEIVQAIRRAHLLGALQTVLRGMKKKQQDEAELKRQEALAKAEDEKKTTESGSSSCCLPRSRPSGQGINSRGYAPVPNTTPFAPFEEKELSVLDVEVEAGGENFSVGQRQLLCMARALLRHSKILVLDEATAAVDTKTDDLIQKTIRSEFKDCTMLTIAHRINTIIDADRVLVMDLGRVAEYDTPKSLLSNEKGAFTSLVNDTGPEVSKFLKDVAFGRIKPFMEEEGVGGADEDTAKDFSKAHEEAKASGVGLNGMNGESK